MFRRIKNSLAAGLVLAMVSGAALPAAADILILSSDVAMLKAGTQLADADKLDLPAGVKVRVLLPSGKTQMLNGPISGFVRDITKGERLVESVWAKAKELFETGGVDQSKVGAVRSIVVAKSAPVVFAWNTIPAAAGGLLCLEKNAAIMIERAENDRTAEVTVVDASANARATVAFADGARQAAWPAAIPLKPDGTYQLVGAGGRLRQVTLRLVDKALTSETATLQALLERDCRAQARAWLAR